jgi:hypothetical protein
MEEWADIAFITSARSHEFSKRSAKMMPSHMGEGAPCLHKSGVLKLWCPLENAQCFSSAFSRGTLKILESAIGVRKLGLRA